MSKFDDITGFEEFSITADVDSTITIYANGNQQGRVYIHLLPMAGDDYIDINDKDLVYSLGDAISLVNYHNNEPLALIPVPYDEYGDHWSYTSCKGEFDQPVPNNIYKYKNTFNDTRSITYTYYIMCPPDENNRSISVAASVKLANGTVITTRKSGAFDSSVSFKGANPPDYKIAYHNGSQSENDDLYVEVNRVRDGKINGDPAWVDNYTVSLKHAKFNWFSMLDDKTVKPAEGWAYPPEPCLYLRHYAYDNQIANICYYWNYSTSGPADIGYIKGSDHDAQFLQVDVNQALDKFNFTVARFEDTDDPNSDHDYESASPQKAVLECAFVDQFGNNGMFYAYPYPESGDNCLRGYKYEFSSSKP